MMTKFGESWEQRSIKNWLIVWKQEDATQQQLNNIGIMILRQEHT